MAGHHDEHGVGAESAAHGTRCLGRTDGAGELPVGGGVAVGNTPGSLPHPLLERRSDGEVHGKGEIAALPAEILVQLLCELGHPPPSGSAS